VRPCKGVLSIAFRARAEGKIGVLVPAENAPEAAVVDGLQVIPVQNLREAAQFLEGGSRNSGYRNVDTLTRLSVVILISAITLHPDEPHVPEPDQNEIREEQRLLPTSNIASNKGN
jgi:hypothetical protein